MTDDSGADVAIIVRTKDRPNLLRRALHSVTTQTYRTWECVIVNDGGDAEITASVVAEFVGFDDRITIVSTPQSRGRWVSANAGVLATSAPLIVIHDDDDTWDPHFLERSAAYLADHPDAGGVVSRIEIVWERESANGFETVSTEIFQPDLAAPTLADTLLFNRFVPIAFVYRRSLHEELGLYDDTLPVVGDWAFNLKVLARGPLEYMSDEPLAKWHQRVEAEGSAANSVIGSRSIHDLFDARIRDEALRQYVSEQGFGLVLYLTKFIDRRFVDVEMGIRAEIARSPARRALRAVRRLFRR